MTQTIFTQEDAKAIARTIIQAWPYSDCHRMNTFASVDSMADLETPTLGHDYSSYEAGDYWSRSWVANGAAPDELKKEYGILAMESKKVSRPSIDSKLNCFPLWFCFLELVDCKECGECRRTNNSVDRWLVKAANRFIDQFMQFGLYSVKLTGGSIELVWSHKLILDNLVTAGTIEKYVEKGMPVRNYIKAPGIDIVATRAGIADGARACTFKIEFCDCYAADGIEFDYAEISQSMSKGVTTCSYC